MCEEDTFIYKNTGPRGHIVSVSPSNGDICNQLEDVQSGDQPLRPQIILALLHSLSVSAIGMSLGHSAVLLPKLEDDTSLTVDEETGSLIASIFMFVSPVGSLLGGILLERIGRKKCYLFSQLIFVLGWVLITTARNHQMVISGRILHGVAVGSVTSAGSILYDELANPKFRSSALTLSASVGAVGVLLMCTLGATLHWRVAAGFATIPLIIHIPVLWLLVPETPTFLVKKNRIAEAELSLKWVWGTGSRYKVLQELRKLTRTFQDQYEEQQPPLLHRWNMADHLSYIKNKYRKYFVPPILKPFLIIEGFNLLQVPCGLGIVLFYTVDILVKVKADKVFDEFSMTILLSCARVVSLIISAFAMFHVGRRTIGILSGVGSSVSALAVGVALYMKNVKGAELVPDDVEAWIIIVLITCYVSINTFGMCCLAYTMIGEVLPVKVRGGLFGLIMATTSFTSGVADKIYPLLIHILGIHGLFILFGVSSVLCSIFIYLLLPETFGRTLNDIEDYFQQENVMWISRTKAPQVAKSLVHE